LTRVFRPLDFGPQQAYIRPVEVCTVSRLYGQAETDSDDKRVFLLEFVAAFAILSLLALVLYIVLTYKPA
jgi:hypothetical protein